MTRFLGIGTVRNEGAFLLEWVAHALAVGFTDLLVFSNDCADGTDAMLDRMAALLPLVHVRNDREEARGPQWAALKRAERHPLLASADWVLAFDVDEFVNVHAGDRTLAALVAALPGASAITLTWRFYGCGGHVGYEDVARTVRFTQAAPRVLAWPWRAALFKTLWRNDGTYAKPGVHRPRAPDPARIGAARWFDGSGRPLPAAFAARGLYSPFGQDNFGLVQLNHYALGEMESFVVKVDRGRANREAGTFDMSYWIDRNFAAEEDASILALAPRVRPILEGLRADPVLARLHAEAVAWRRRRFAELMREEPFRALFGRLQMTPPTRPLAPAAAARLIGWARAARAAGTAGSDANP
ncbi:MAG: glycosyltransferase family 2 protein [Rhodobacteraceae bacterium]|jgi:hypothetical protein|nr:glycosyltransferase family 2 protein [Paracoccaceae bacterium]